MTNNNNNENKKHSLDDLMSDDYKPEKREPKAKKKKKKGFFSKMLSGGAEDADGSTGFDERKSSNSSKNEKPSFKKFLFKNKWMFVAIIVSFITGCFAVSFITSDTQEDQVYKPDKPMSLEDSIDNVRSSQIESLQDQFTEIKNENADAQGESPDDPSNMSEKQKVIADAISQNKDSVEEPLKIAMNLHYDADDQTKEQAKKDIVKNIDENHLSKEELDNIVNGNSASKELKQYGAKSGASNPAILGVDKKDNFTYLTITPFTVKDRTVNALHIVKLNNKGKLVSLHYTGYIHSNGHNRAKDIATYMSSSLKDGQKELKEIDKPIKLKEEVEKEEKEQKEKEEKEKKEKEKEQKEKEEKEKKDKK